MATAQKFLYADNSTLANFQGWAGALSAAFAAFGWTKSSDTGQTAPGSAAAVPAVSTSIYEIWMMSDSLASTNPVYVKVQYGTGTTSSYPALTITVGSGSNGAGILTNAGSPISFGPGTTGGTAQIYECDFSGTGGRMQFCLWRGYTYPSIFSIERSHNATGGDSASYVTTLWSGFAAGSPYCFQQSLMPAATGGPLYKENYGLTMQTGNVSANYANTVAVSPFFPFVGYVDNPMLGLMCAKNNDFSDGSQFLLYAYGANHNYLVTKFANALWGNQTTNTVAIRYE